MNAYPHSLADNQISLIVVLWKDVRALEAELRDVYSDVLLPADDDLALKLRVGRIAYIVDLRERLNHARMNLSTALAHVGLPRDAIGYEWAKQS